MVIMLLFFAAYTNSARVMAGDYYRESLYFDEDGNFYMTTYDIKATKSTRYCTLGWTIKRYDLPIDDPENMCATIVITCDASIEDPENEQYLYSYFHCDRYTIFNAVGAVSEEWQRELYLNGSTVYLDGIMTVIENNVPQGSLTSSGHIRGEVYDTYEGIVSARSWGPISKDSLRTHFNKRVYFSPVDTFFREEGDEEEVREKLFLEEDYYWWGPEPKESVRISADSFDPSVAIPSGESVEVVGFQQEYAYRIEYVKVSGRTACTIPVVLMATQTGTDETGLPVEIQVPVATGTYDYMMPYMYYELSSIDLCYADGMSVISEAFGGRVNIDTNYDIDVEMTIRGASEHIVCDAVTEPVEVNIGTLTDEEEIDARIMAAVAGVANKPRVRNDYLSIDGNVIMSDEWTESARAPQKTASPSKMDDSKIAILPADVPNSEYSVKIIAYYRYLNVSGAGGDYFTKTKANAGKITVHTPVVCYGSVEDIKEWNQAETPDEENSTIVLGKEFTVTVSNKGAHIGAKGYGTGDYSKYVLHNQVRFPFEVMSASGESFSAGTWINIGPEVKFIPPTTVPEGEYKVELRAIAGNFDESLADSQGLGQNANLLPSEQGAVDYATVRVIGQLYGFELTRLTEYKSVIALKEQTGGCAVSELPLVWEDKGLPLGSSFMFSLKSVGGYEDGATVTITPSFWYITEDGQVEADVYYEDIEAGEFVLKRWNTEKHNIELSDCTVVAMSEEDLGVNSNDTSNNVSASNNTYQLWSGIYTLPVRAYFLPKNTALPQYGIRRDTFLKNGQILVKFDIKIEDENGENALLYINSENAEKGYCNRWRAEGGNDGEVIAYDIGKTVKDSMKIRGTH